MRTSHTVVGHRGPQAEGWGGGWGSRWGQCDVVHSSVFKAAVSVGWLALG